MGPIEAVIVTFPRAGQVAAVGPIMEDLVDSDHIRVVDAILVTWDAAGELVVNDIDDALVPLWSSISTAPQPLLNAEDAALAGQDLRPDGAAFVVVIEQTWPDHLAKLVEDSGGNVALHVRIDPDTVEIAARQNA
ncbi:MAG TPA: hypothetical protein VGM94_13395 [Galbitalea sp.]|jgi:hypothetical protein